MGSGGGGDPRVARLLVEHLWLGDDGIEVVSASELSETDGVIHAGLVGSVTAFGERAASGSEFTDAFDRLEHHLSRSSFTVVAGFETAGVNALLPLLIALQRRLRFVDVDVMGRGLSRMDQTTYAAAGIPICPFVLTAPAGHSFIVENTPGDEAERYARALTFQMGGWSAFAGYPVDRDTCIRYGIAGTLQRCVAIGRTSSLDELLSQDDLNVRMIATGRVAVARWSYPEGFPRLTAIVQPHDPSQSPIRIEASNEFLLVSAEGRIAAQSPEIICLVDIASGEPLLTERVTAGAEVAIIVLPAPARWREPDFSGRVSPRAHGIDLPEWIA